MSFTIGSLFDGSGGFPLAAFLCGGIPVWAAEIEPYPIAVTKSRFPYMKHLGSVTDIRGDQIDPVDVITFGSPCQDLSVAGKRAGLKHENNGDDETTRSGLFIEAVRIITEMRRATNGIYPRIAVWENVPGAFSSHRGEDFRLVLEELIKICEPNAIMPGVPKRGWPYADSYRGNRWSLAYRVFDAQYWGVPQRRRRIYLVLDLTGGCAGEILFERDGLRGYFEEGGTPWQTTPADVERGVRTNDNAGSTCYSLGCDIYNGAVTGTVATTLTTATGQGASNTGPSVIVAAGFKEHNSADARSIGFEEETSPTLSANKHDATVCVFRADTGSGGNVCNTLVGDHNNRVTDYTALVVEQSPTSSVAYGFDPSAARDVGVLFEEEVSKTITNGSSPGHHTGVVIAETEKPIVLDRAFYNQGENDLYDPQIYDDGTVPTIVARGPSAVAIRYIVRRLTPIECARLQGFADQWAVPDKKTEFTDEEYRFWLNVRNTHAAINGKTVKDYTLKQILTWYNKLHTDSSEYKLWGNGIALPCALYVMQGIGEVFAREKI